MGYGKMKKMSYGKGGSVRPGTKLKNALIAKGYKKGGYVKPKKSSKSSYEQYD